MSRPFPSALIVVILAGGSARGVERPETSSSAARCRGLAEAVLSRDLDRLKLLLGSGCDPRAYPGAISPLQLAIARGQVEETRLLLGAGADPNAIGRDGSPIVRWLGSGQRFTDADLLEVAMLLDRYHCSFDGGASTKPVDLIVNLSGRRVPRTLEFLASKHIRGDYARALRAIARSEDLASMKVLLDGGASPSPVLRDAASAGRTAAVALMLTYVTDRGSPQVLAAYESAIRGGHADTAQAFADAGVERPQRTEPPRPTFERRELTPAQSRLMSQLGLPNANGLAGLAGGMKCKLAQECGALILVDCNSAADGPAYYIDQQAPKLLATCGGACMLGCTGCPPPEWKCVK
jgi:Ankyrin repeat